MKIRYLLWLFLCLLLLQPAVSDAGRVYLCNRLTDNPVLDGKLDEEVWNNVPQGGSFYKFPTNAPASKQTSFKIGYTPEAIYIGMKCNEPETKKIKAKLKNMDNLCGEDSVEIFVAPKGKSYYQFMINAVGSRWSCEFFDKYLAGGKAMVPLSGWKAKTYTGKDYWSIEIKIPWEFFLTIPDKGDEWKGNLCRNIFTSGDRNSSWANVKAGFHEPDSFGKLVFMGKILPDEGKKTKRKIVNTIKKDLQKNLGLIRGSEDEFREASKKYPSLHKRIDLFIENNEETKKRFAKISEYDVKEWNLLHKKSMKLVKQFNKLKAEIITENLFD
jgi:hypothetical protein